MARGALTLARSGPLGSGAELNWAWAPRCLTQCRPGWSLPEAPRSKVADRSCRGPCRHKHDLEDWTRAFHRSMARRAAALQHGCFVGLSGGVDSGCIALRLAEMQVAHHLFSLSASEDTRVLEARHAWATLTLTLTLTLTP